MKYRIAADSSSDLRSLAGADFASVPLKIVTEQREYIDDETLDVAAMCADLAAYKGRSGTSCPSVGDWLEAFGDADRVFAVAITSNLSGSYNAAVQAKAVYEEQYPDRKVCCLDTLTTGPEMALILEKIQQLIGQGMAFEEIETAVKAYNRRTQLLFMLESVDNLAKNGRVNHLIAKAVGFLNIRIVGKASDVGTLQQLHKCRGENRGLETLLREMTELGFRGGPVRITHCLNPECAQRAAERILEAFPASDVKIYPTGGLCSFYAEKGSILVGFEG